MHFNQLKREPGAVVRKKMYKKGRVWIVATLLSVTGGLMMMTTNTTNVQADLVDEQNTIAGVSPSSVVATGFDGTSTYNLTSDGTLYFSAGTLDHDDTRDLLNYKLRNKFKKIDTSLAQGKVYAPINSTSLFSYQYQHIDFDLSNFDTHQVINMDHMFYGTKTNHLDLSKFDTSSVTNMDSMFQNTTLYSLDLRSFNTTQVRSMSQMFADMTKLKEIDVSSFNTENVRSMSMLFSGDSLLSTLDISNFVIRRNGNSISPTINLLDLTNLKSITLGVDNDLFDCKIPSEYGVWVNVGKGTIDNPQANLVIADKQFAQYYDSTGKTPTQTFVPAQSKLEPTIPQTYPLDPQATYPAIAKISTNDGIKSVDVMGKPNETILIKVPDKEGYTADKKTVTGVFDAYGNVTVSETVTYKKIGTEQPKDPNDSKDDTKDEQSKPDKTTDDSKNNDDNVKGKQNVTITQDKQTIATLANGNDVQLYRLSGNQMHQVKNRALAANSTWASDKKVTIADITYYRVATNEWVTSDDTYSYQSVNAVIKANSGDVKTLIHGDGSAVRNRALAPNSSWRTDRIVYIAGKAYYRVATNEFVSVNDAQ